MLPPPPGNFLVFADPSVWGAINYCPYVLRDIFHGKPTAVERIKECTLNLMVVVISSAALATNKIGISSSAARMLSPQLVPSPLVSLAICIFVKWVARCSPLWSYYPRVYGSNRNA